MLDNILVPAILSLGATALVILFIVMGYIKAPPDQVVIISGIRRKPRMIVGKSSFRIPFLERVDRLSLRLMPVDVKTSSSVPTADYININVDANVNVKVGDSTDMLQLAAQNFLNRGEDYISTVAREVLEGNMREIVGQMQLRDMVSDRQAFADKVKDNAAPDLEKMGLDIVNFNVQNFIDSNGVIEDLGVDNISQIKKDAAIAKAQSERDVAIAQSKAAKESNDARIEANLEIAQHNTDLEMRQAELKLSADAKKAKADSAYRIEEEAQRKVVEVASQDAEIAKAERAIELEERQVSVTKQVLAAKIKEEAEASRFAREQEAQAKLFESQKQAEAAKYTAQQRAEAQKAEAEAVKFAKLQEAEGIKAVGEAEAESIRMKGLAEAEGIDKKAEAMKKMEEAAVLEMFFKAWPEAVSNAAQPLGNIDELIMYGDGNTDKLVGNVINTVSQVTEGVKRSTGLDLGDILAGFLGGKTALNGIANDGSEQKN